MDIKNIFNIAIEKKASDIHLIVGLKPFLRVDGELKEVENSKVISEIEMEKETFSLLTEEQKKSFLAKKELDFGIEIKDGARFRVNIHFEKNNIGLVARIITSDLPSLDSILMPKVIVDLLSLKQGLILVTGPTGCGKSTALAAMINYVNHHQRCNIITFEDPIEYIFKSEQSIIIQRQLGTDMLSFADGLKHSLRQDPDIIMVGEMRDLDTVAATITLAETGHLVFATLHTYSAAQTIDRIIDIFPPYQHNQIRVQLSMTLAGVISQRLLAKVGGGRIATREILINTPAVANLIRENKIPQIRTVIETSSKYGMITMDQDIKKLYKQGLVEKAVARTQMMNPAELAS